jgi:exodeoxyribonuclease VII small subunit
MTPKKSSKNESDALSFDERLQRLEEIVGALEEGGLGLESSIERYREGV